MAVTDPHVRDIDRRVDIQRHDNSLYERTGIAGWIVLILFVGGLSAIVYGATLRMNPATNPAASMAQMAPASPDTGVSKGPASSP